MALVVTAPLAVVRKVDQSHIYLYRGTVVPDGLDEVDVQRLVNEGFIEDHDVLLVAPEQGAVRPAANAKLEVWQVYAKNNGYTDADISGLKRDDIRDLFA